MNTPFNSYKEAADYARELACGSGETVRIVRNEGKFIVEWPESLGLDDDTDRHHEEDTSVELFKSDYVLLQEEIDDELRGYTISSARSDEEGWLYDDED